MMRKLEYGEWEDIHEDEAHELLRMLLDHLKLEVWEHKWDGQGRREFEIRPASHPQ